MAWDEGDSWSWVGFVMRTGPFSHLYVPYGPTLASAESLREALDSVRRAGRELKTDFVRVEPIGCGRNPLHNAGLRPVPAVQPDRTLVVDLSRTEEELRNELSSGHRYAVNRAGRIGMEFVTTDVLECIDGVIRLLEQTAADRRFRSHQASYLRTLLESLMPIGAARVGLARHEGNVVSAAIALDYNDTRAYAHAGNSAEARKLQSSAPLVWHLMLDARRRGLTRFDLWGIAPPGTDVSNPWSGFTKFKRAFGGKEIEYPGAWELPVHEGRYRALQLAKRLARSVRRRK